MWMVRVRFFLVIVIVVVIGPSIAEATEPAADGDSERIVFVISDLHMGLGRLPDRTWDPKEDFRWEGALRGFLTHISREYNNKVDLVIAGDFLELWQPPAAVTCEGDGPNYGCTIAEMKEIVRHVISAHEGELIALSEFAKTEGNQVYVIPGNHDSALVIPGVWQMLQEAMPGSIGHVDLVVSGVWTSADGKVLVEHGHQIGSDVNRYRDWPKVTARRDGEDYMIRPWGELFVQRLFNAEENRYPIIDNLSPETAGARYRMADRGVWGSASDIARFIAFNIFETSAKQKGASLGGQRESEACSRDEAEKLGHRLVLGTLKPNDPFRIQAESQTVEAQQLRKELDALVTELPDEDIQNLCARQVDSTTLGAMLESKLFPRKDILHKHLNERITTHQNAMFFVYGHTHQYEKAWDMELKPGRQITVLNSGAFQRLLDEEGYTERVKDLRLIEREHEGLSKIDLDTLAPCYGVVSVQYYSGVPIAKMEMWHMPKNGVGRFVSPRSKRCR